MGRIVVFLCLIGLLLVATSEVATARKSSLRVHVVLDQHVPSDMGEPAIKWQPQSNRSVHVAIGAWQDSTLTDYGGNAWFPVVPAGNARVWCNPHSFAGNPESLETGGQVTIPRRATVTDTQRLRCLVMGLFR